MQPILCLESNNKKIMSKLSEPISINHLLEDAHRLNQEIIRLASVLKINIANPSCITKLINTPHPSCDDHFHKCETLKGLIILRGKLAIELKEAQYQDEINPVHESIYEYLFKTQG